MITLGTAPDSWGVWFAADPAQIPYPRFLDEVAESGYRAIELGPYGYLPTQPDRLARELSARGLTLTAGTVFEHLHRHDEWDDIAPVAELAATAGAADLVVIPGLWRHPIDGTALDAPELSAAQWRTKLDRLAELSHKLSAQFGLRLQYHPHADSHVAGPAQVARVLADTGVSLCLDTGHIAYCGGDVETLLASHADRIGYLHLKQIDPDVVAKAAADDIPFGEAVRMDCFVEPPTGVPSFDPVFAALAHRDIVAIVEQDMYPCAPERPLPIARRTRNYLRGCGIG